MSLYSLSTECAPPGFSVIEYLNIMKSFVIVSTLTYWNSVYTKTQTYWYSNIKTNIVNRLLWQNNSFIEKIFCVAHQSKEAQLGLTPTLQLMHSCTWNLLRACSCSAGEAAAGEKRREKRRAGGITALEWTKRRLWRRHTGGSFLLAVQKALFGLNHLLPAADI